MTRKSGSSDDFCRRRYEKSSKQLGRAKTKNCAKEVVTL